MKMTIDLTGGKKKDPFKKKKSPTTQEIKKMLEPIGGEVVETKEEKIYLTPEMKARIIKKLRLLEDE